MLDSNLLETDLKKGLSVIEAKKRLENLGPNTIRSKEKKSVFKIFLNQFKDFMIILLLIAAAISFSVAIYEAVKNANTGYKHNTEVIVGFIEPIIILIVIALNSMLGTYQEIKSDQAIKALEKNNELNAKVIRDGKLMLIPATELVVGDLIVAEAGDAISADGILVEASHLMVVESALTGESTSVSKRVGECDENKPLAEQFNRVFSGTNVVNGRLVALVTKTGKDTEIGKINKLLSEQKVNLTPLQIKLNKLSRILGIAGVVLLVITVILQVVITNAPSGTWNNATSYSDALTIGISLAVAAIPEGLITFTTVLLAIGVSKLTKEHAIIKSFASVETLGSVSIICSDKTGTLTENKMTVVDLYDASAKGEKGEKSRALAALVACCDASVTVENNEYVEVGDPTETGILRYGIENNNSAQRFWSGYDKLSSIPFDSDRKLMSVLAQNKKDPKIKVMFTKGAPDVLLSKCKNVSEEDYNLLEQWSAKAYRVIAVAYKNIKDEQKIELVHDDENDLTFLGLVAMIDPPRSSVKSSIEESINAGIKPVMITGDHVTTAVAIAKSLNIFKEGDLAITGEELQNMSDEELKAKVSLISVYARVNPSDKLRIVKAWQSHNQVVAMTGDGVNDAPALKASDIGCAMGITGTDVSKQAADVILTDDNFNTIVKSVRTGRETFDKIKTVIMNLLVSSLTEIIVMMIGLFAFRFIFKGSIENVAKGEEIQFWVLSASQLLWINLLTHGLPAIALGMVDSGIDVMKRKPFNKNDSIFAHGMGKRLVIHSAIIGGASILSYLFVGLIAQEQGVHGIDFVRVTSSACFITLGIGASLNALNLMSDENIYKCSFNRYKLVYLASLFSFVCVILAAFVPGLSTVFKMADPSIFNNYNPGYAILPILLGFVLIVYEEILKAVRHYKKVNKS